MKKALFLIFIIAAGCEPIPPKKIHKTFYNCQKHIIEDVECVICTGSWENIDVSCIGKTNTRHIKRLHGLGNEKSSSRDVGKDG